MKLRNSVHHADTSNVSGMYEINAPIPGLFFILKSLIPKDIGHVFLPALVGDRLLLSFVISDPSSWSLGNTALLFQLSYKVNIKCSFSR